MIDPQAQEMAQVALNRFRPNAVGGGGGGGGGAITNIFAGPGIVVDQPTGDVTIGAILYDTIYSADGSLDSARTIDAAGFPLTIQDFVSFLVNSDSTGAAAHAAHIKIEGDTTNYYEVEALAENNAGDTAGMLAIADATGGQLTLSANEKMFFKSKSVINATAVEGQVPNLIDPITGEWDWGSAGSSVVSAVNLSALDVTNIPDGTTVYVSGITAPGDGRSGVFQYSALSALTTIPGMIIDPDVGDGQWLRDYGNYIDPLWLGGDNTGALDSYVPFQGSIDFAANPTYGWAKEAGNLGYLGLGVGFMGIYKVQQTLVMHGAVDLFGHKHLYGINDYNQAAAIYNYHGGHCITWDIQTDAPSGSIRGITIRDLQLIGFSSFFSTDVSVLVSGTSSRTVFTVANADAPFEYGTATISIASPAVITRVAHPFIVNEAIVVTTSGGLPTGLTPGSTIYVIATGFGPDSFQVSDTLGGAAIDTSGAQSGVHGVEQAMDVIPEYAANNACLFYDDQQTYLGSGRIASISHSLTQTTITLETGMDCYSSVEGTAGNLLRPWLDAVVFAPKINTENSVAAGIQSGFVDPGSAGSSGIFLRNTHATALAPFPRLDNVFVRSFTTGIRVGPRIVGGAGANDIHIQRCRFAGWCFPRSINDTDTFFTGDQYVTGLRGADFVTPPVSPNTIDLPEFTHCTYGAFNWASAAKTDSMLLEECAYAQMYTARTYWPTFGHLLLDGVIRYGLVFGPGFFGYVAPTTTLASNSFSCGRLFIRSALDGRDWDTIHGEYGAIKWESTYATTRSTFANIGELMVIRGGLTTPILDYVCDMGPVSGNNNRLTVVKLSERNGATLLIKAGSKPIDSETPFATTAAEANFGWYQASYSSTSRGFAIAGAKMLEITTSGMTLGQSALTTALAVTGGASGAAIVTWERLSGTTQKFGWHIGTGDIRLVNTTLARDVLRILDSTNHIFYFGGVGASTPKTTQFYAEAAVGTDIAGAYFDFVASAGTGNNTTAGDFRFYTYAIVASGSGAQTAVLRMVLKKEGQLRIVPLAADPTINVEEGDMYPNSVSKKLRVALNGSYKTIDHWAARTDAATTVTVLATDTLVVLTAGSASVVNLPAVATANQRLAFKVTGAGTATLTPAGADTLFTTTSVASLAMVTGDYRLLHSDGVRWLVL